MFPLSALSTKTASGSTNRPVRGFNVGVQKHPFTHIDCAGRICGISTMGMMGVVIIKPAQNQFAGISFPVAIGVFKQDKVRPLRDVDTLRCKCKSERQMQSVCKRCDLVRSEERG